MKYNEENERIKRAYRLHMKAARGLSDASIDVASAAIHRLRKTLCGSAQHLTPLSAPKVDPIISDEAPELLGENSSCVGSMRVPITSE